MRINTERGTQPHYGKGLRPVDRAAFRIWTNRIEAAMNVASAPKGNVMQETKTREQQYIDCILALCGGDTHKAFELYQASIYGESHERNEDETEEQWFVRCATQDFDDGYDACLFPEFFPDSEE